jgi:uncharacterized repeat protein (TIGR03803 family)
MSASPFHRLLCTRFLAATLIIAAVASYPAQAQTFKSIYASDGTNDTLVNPSSQSVAQGRDGELYFTSTNGGTFYGTLFKISATGAAAVVNDVGYFVNSGATLGTDGNFYLTNQDGGSAGFGCGFAGCGQIAKVTPAGVETVLYSFLGQGDGADPQSAPIQAANGLFYGTASADGDSDNEGTAYSITSAGAFTLLHKFDATTEGYTIQAGLVQGTDGNFYGTTMYGGTNGDGTIFKMTPTGTVTVLHNFAGTDGSKGCCSLVQASDGNFYGVAQAGGTFGYGVIYKITPAGTYTVLHNFNPANEDGEFPGSELTIGTDGKLYGVTTSGSGGYSGTLFNVTTSGTLTTLYTFCQNSSCTDGFGPSSPLKQNTSGIFYGSTYTGGDMSACDAGGCGTVFSLNMGLKPFAALETTSGKEGAKIGILGQGFTTATKVSFAGVEASSVALSGAKFLSVAVPAGALTGAVTVTTGSTTLTSSQVFRVTPTFASFKPSSGDVGTPVTITGTGLTQTTGVSFNGKKATFTVNSDTEITADVPTGATSGKVEVITKGGQVLSSTSFTVTK